MVIVSLIVLQLIIFGGLIIVFRKIMTQNVVSATKHLDELKHDYDEKEKQVDNKTQEMERKAEDIMIQAQNESAKIKLEIQSSAEEEKNKIIAAARTQADEIIRQAEKSRQQLILEIEQRIQKEAVNKAGELIQDTLSEPFKKMAHLSWVDDLIENGFSQLQSLRIEEDLKEIKLVSAFPLSDEQRKRIAKKIKEALGRELTISEEVDPKVIAGVAINIGSLVLDGTLRNKVKEQAMIKKG
jgi:F-type H+-transporting ATPase subunit b